MKKLFVIICLSVGLAGCGQDFARFWQAVTAVNAATVPGYLVVAAVQTFDSTQLAAAAYLRLPRCGAGSSVACRVPEATPIIKGAFWSGRIARNSLKTELRAACRTEFAAGQECAAGIPVASYNTLVSATKTIDGVISTWRVATGK